MIRYFRGNIQGNVAKVFVVLICIPFVLFGAESIFSAGGEPKVAKVDGEAITQRELDSEIQRSINRIARMQGENFDASSIEPETLRPAAIESLVNRALMMQLADEQNMAVAVESADKAIVELDTFHVDGKFSADMYKNILRGSGHTPTTFKQIVSDDILVSQANSALSAGMFVTDAEVDALIKLDFETRDIAYLTIEPAAVEQTVEVSTDEIQQYFDENNAAFMTDEKVAVDYVEIKLEDYFQDVDPQDLQEAYETHIAEMVLPTQRQAAHILVEFSGSDERADAETKLLEAKQRIESGEAFATLAEEMSDDIGSASQGGDLGYTSGELFPQAFEEALAALEIGELSQPVETEAGLHLITVLDIEESDKPSLEDLTPSLTTQLQRLQASDEFEQQLELLRDLSFDSDAISSIGEEMGAAVQSSGKFSREGAINGVFTNGALVSKAFSNEVMLDGRISEVIEISADQFIVMQVAEHEPAVLKALETVSSDIEVILKEEKTATALNEKADSAIEALNSGGSIETVAADLGVEFTAFEAISRREPGEANRQVVNAAFATALEGEQSVDKAVLRDNSVAIFVSSNAVEGDIAQIDEQQKLSMKRLLQSLRGRAETGAFIQALNDRADIDIL